MKEILGVLINPKERKAEKVTFKPTLDEYYRLLGCDLIDYGQRCVGGTNVTIVCDDEGNFDSTNVVSAVDKDRCTMFVGTILVIGFDNVDGNDTGLTDEQADAVLSNVATVGTLDKKGDYSIIKVLTNCEFV